VSPVRASERRRNPVNWPAISARIRFERADGRCEREGECGTGHAGRCEARHGLPHPATGSRVVLTTAHLDHVPENCGDENLRAMCQRCHLAYDAPQHAATAAAARAARSRLAVPAGSGRSEAAEGIRSRGGNGPADWLSALRGRVWLAMAGPCSPPVTRGALGTARFCGPSLPGVLSFRADLAADRPMAMCADLRI
jgi:hypothetical protein